MVSEDEQLQTWHIREYATSIYPLENNILLMFG